METEQDGASTEYERRFLVTDLSILKDPGGDRILQGYPWERDGYILRVRISVDERAVDRTPVATLAVKGPRAGATRFETEGEVPVSDARRLIDSSGFTIVKVRYPFISEGELWVIDVFEGENDGLAIAEFEGSQSAVRNIRVPWWAASEVTDDRRFDNESLARRPWSRWDESERPVV